MEKIRKFIGRYFIGLIIGLGLFGYFIVPSVIDGLTSTQRLTSKLIKKEYKDLSKIDVVNVNNLSNCLHELSKFTDDGAICQDGSQSHSTGRGTCSYHHGVARWVSKGEYGKTIDECRTKAVQIINKYREEAREISWID